MLPLLAMGDPLAHDFPRPQHRESHTSGKIQSMNLDAILPSDCNSRRVNELLSLHPQIGLKVSHARTLVQTPHADYNYRT